MKVLLLFPPQLLPLQPHIGLPLILSMLRANDIDCEQKDLNITAFDHFLSRDFLSYCLKKIKTNGVRRPLHKLEKGLLPISHVIGKEIVQEVEEAKKIFRDPASIDEFEKLLHARRILTAATSLILSDAYSPTIFRLDHYAMRYSNRDSREIQKALFDENENPFIDYFLEVVPQLLKNDKPDLIGLGISVTDQLIPAFTLCRIIKEHSNAPIVLGGSTTTRLAESLIKSSLVKYFDYLITYEGETSFVELCHRIKKGKSFQGIPNLIFKKDGKLIKYSEIYSENIDLLPTPSFDGLELDLYLSPYPILTMLTSRRCIWDRCAFCDINYAYSPKHRQRSPELIVEDIYKLSKQYKTKFFKFVDESFSPSIMSRIVDLSKKKGLNFYWDAYVRVEHQFNDFSFLKKIHDGGCRALHFGFETASQEISNRMNKGIKIAIMKDILKKSNEAGILNHIWIIFGFPGETEEDVQETKNFVMSNINNIHSIEINNFTLMKNSIIGRNSHAYNISFVHKNPEEDLALFYDYEVYEGISQNRAKQIAEEFNFQLRADKRLYVNLIMEILGPHRIAFMSKHDLRVFLSKYFSGPQKGESVIGYK